MRVTQPHRSFTEGGLQAGSSYACSVTALDTVGNESSANPQRPVTTLDTTAPDPPQGVIGTALSGSEVELTWQPAVDNVEVQRYRVIRDGEHRATITETIFTDSNLKAGIDYAYAVIAEDTSKRSEEHTSELQSH